MLFGLQAPAQLSAVDVLDAKNRLQRKMEQDPEVTTMQPGGAFVWSGGGQRLTPEQMAGRQRMASQNMEAGMDTSPVGHWTEGAARVARALVGGMEQRRLDRAAAANAAESGAVARLLAGGGKGVDPAAYDATLIGAATNKYIDPAVRDLALSERERIAKANAPEYFMSGRDRVRFDPRTGTSSVVYDGQEDFQTYASSMGFQPGTPEYNTAQQDFVLRSNGPTAFGYDVDLENERQSNRVDLEGERQRNRLTLRQTPTYRDAHPRPAGGGNGGGRSASRQPTMAGTMAPILAKVAEGKALTPGEQQAWGMYRSGKSGARAAVVGALSGNGGGGGGAGGLPRPASREDFNRLPKGARFIDPQGTVRTK